MDPWCSGRRLSSGHEQVAAVVEQEAAASTNQFCDSFVGGQAAATATNNNLGSFPPAAVAAADDHAGFTRSPQGDDNGAFFQKLPDSDEYLKRLEARLELIQRKGGSDKKPSFAQNKEQILGNLLRSESKQVLGILSDSDISLDRELVTNPLLRQLVPRQPITIGETVKLLEADQLDQGPANQEESSSGNNSSSDNNSSSINSLRPPASEP